MKEGAGKRRRSGSGARPTVTVAERTVFASPWDGNQRQGVTPPQR